MKIHNFISIILLLLFAVALVQCSKESATTEHNNRKLELRSDPDISGQVISPSCGISDYDERFTCIFHANVVDTLIAQNGCKVIVSMNVDYCGAIYGDDVFVVFRDLGWSLLHPSSSNCEQWWMSLIAQIPGVQNELLDEFIDDIQQKFENRFMDNFVREENYFCQSNDQSASSLFFKSPCVQRCVTMPSNYGTDPFFIYDSPCATDGCCLKITVHCLDTISNEVRIFGPNIEPIYPCTNFIQVNCIKGTMPLGGCRDELCN